MCDLVAKFSGMFVIFLGFLWSSSVSSWLIHCSSSVSFFSDSVWLRFDAKKLSIVRTCFWCDMLIARWVHYAWFSMRRACSVEHDWNVTWEWTLNGQHAITGCDKIHFPRSVLACHFCTELNLFMCTSFRVFSVNFEGDKSWPFFKGQFQLQCRIGAMAQPGSNPDLVIYAISPKRAHVKYVLLYSCKLFIIMTNVTYPAWLGTFCLGLALDCC